jgi:hypothetical protein
MLCERQRGLGCDMSVERLLLTARVGKSIAPVGGNVGLNNVPRPLFWFQHNQVPVSNKSESWFE